MNFDEYRAFIRQQVDSSGVPIDGDRLASAIINRWMDLDADPEVNNDDLPIFFVNARHNYRCRALVFEGGDFDAPLKGALGALDKGGREYMTNVIRRFVHPDHYDNREVTQRALDMAKLIVLAARKREHYPPDAYAFFVDSQGMAQAMTMTTRIAKEHIH